MLIFLRHAHRDTNQRFLDNGLDEKGQQQVEKLKEELRSKKLPQGDIFWSSPKKRCVETIESLAELCSQELVIKSELDEQLSTETTKDFRKRIFTFLEEVTKINKTIYLCSHGDVIPEMIQELTGQWVDIKKGQYILCEKSNHKWNVKS